MSKHIYNTGAAGVGHVRARFGGGLVVLWSRYGMVWYGMVCYHKLERGKSNLLSLLLQLLTLSLRIGRKQLQTLPRGRPFENGCAAPKLPTKRHQTAAPAMMPRTATATSSPRPASGSAATTTSRRGAALPREVLDEAGPPAR